MKKSTSGFTIVELLIVIVVIAILAAISIAAYSGIQTRANNTQTISAVKEYVKAFSLYALDNDDYPNAAGCLGEGYPTPNNRCLSQGGTAACFGLGSDTNQAVTNALKPYTDGASPRVSMQRVSCGGGTYVGAYAWYNSANQTMVVIMMLKGSQACPPMSPNVSVMSTTPADDGSMCRYTLAAV